jgi:hypothetical protein
VPSPVGVLPVIAVQTSSLPPSLCNLNMFSAHGASIFAFVSGRPEPI